jgi:lysosomal acid lipase/cholesteryl ester hydrolase
MTINEIIHLSTTSELILMWNYPLEEHCVHVSDGVVLTLHRIPNPRFGSTRYTHVEPCERQGVLVWHGFGLSSNVWVCAPEGPTHNLAFVLADAGFDVWYVVLSVISFLIFITRLANARGTMYTRGKKDWDFSMDEMAHLDIPAVVDYILERVFKV